MSRRRRVYSEMGYYHIVLKGIDDRLLFLDDEDKGRFLHCMYNARKKGGFQILAYCLMNNHVHMIIKEGEAIGESIKRMSVAYVHWHNKKHSRSGHLFRNRYFSKVIEDEAYLIRSVRYVHQNPLKAKLVEKLGDYKWSTYQSYIVSYNIDNIPIDEGLIKSIFTNVNAFVRYHEVFDMEEDLDVLTEEKRKAIGRKTVAIKDQLDTEGINRLSIEERNVELKRIQKTYGFSNIQLAKYLNISTSTVSRALKS